MCRRRSDISARLTLALLALASLTLSGTSLADRSMRNQPGHALREVKISP